MSSCPLSQQTELVAHYELLRTAAIDLHSVRSSAPGLALLLRQGMLAWMRNCIRLLPVAAIAAKAVSAPPSRMAPELNDVRTQWITMMAELVVHNLMLAPEEVSCR